MDCHMMVSKPEQVGSFPKYSPISSVLTPPPQWVDAIANAGGKLYCFHIEATCERTHTTVDILKFKS